MSISNLSGYGDNNKIYLVEGTISLSERDVYFCFYSTKKINNIVDLREFLSTKANNTINVFGSGYKFSNTICLIPCLIRYMPDTHIIYLYYYMNDENGYRSSTVSSVTFYNKEV